MTAAAVKSTMVSNAEAVPVTLANPDKARGKIRVYSATIEVATTSLDDVGDIIHMLRIPASFVPTSILVFNDALDTHSTPTLAADVGLYRADGTNTVLDADAFGSAITTLRSANTLGVNVQYEQADIANIGKQAWQYAAGVTTTPSSDVLVSLTITATAATGAAGTISIQITGVDG